jgi:5'-nucleotidase (lipoprotein e(P4) family)
MKNLLFVLNIFIWIAINPSLAQDADSNEKLSESEHLVMATDWFQKSAEMRACYYQAYQLAKWRLDQKLASRQNQKPAAIVFDIDETVLDNSAYEVHLIQTGQLYSSEGWKQWTDRVDARALPGALEFTKYAKSKGVEVIYISNRKADEREPTLKNLKKEGFPNADSVFLFLREINQNNDKTMRRNTVIETYDVLLYVGDNLTDFSQIFAERGADLGFQVVDSLRDLFGDNYIILPNPTYGEWEGAIYGNNYKQTPEKKRALRKRVLKGY